MHPALRKGPLFTKKQPLHFQLYTKTSPISFPAYGPGIDKLCSTVHRRLQHEAPHYTRRTAACTTQTLLVGSICWVAGNTVPQYMADFCMHNSDIARRQHLRSAGCHQLFVPRHRRSMFGRRAFFVAGPAACNSLPDSFRLDLKTFLYSLY